MIIRTFLSFCGILTALSSAHAISTFYFDLNVNEESSLTLNDNGIELVVDNALQVGGVATLFISSPNGITFSNQLSPAVESFDLTFDTDVYITSYGIGEVLNGGGDFNLAVTGGSSLSNLSATSVGSISLGASQLYVPQSTVVSFTAVNFSGVPSGASFLSSLTVSPVPEPQYYTLIATLMVIGIVIHRKSKRTI